MSDTPATIHPHQVDDIILELRTIRKLLEAQAEERKAASPAPAAQPSYSTSTSSSGGKFGDEPIPQPNPMWALHEAEAHAVHFGKNNGVLLRDLADRSLSFYAKDKPPQLDSKGKPYPKRPIDTDLENAARTVWHYRRGTLANGAQQPAPASTQPPKASTPAAAKTSGDEDVPF